MLTNPRSDRVKAVRALSRRSARERSGRFVADGPQAVREAVAYAGAGLLDLYVTQEGQRRHPGLVESARAAGRHVHEVTDDVLVAMSETGAPQGLLAVCRRPDATLEQVLAAAPRLLVLLANVRDPGNAGTVIRGADAAGADAVLVSDASVDVYAPKAVRSTAGSAFHLPVVTGLDVAATVAALRAHGIRVLAADGAGSTLLPDADLTGPHAWLLGNEAWGLSEETRSLADDVVRVPILGRAESLNLAMAATVCLYASAAVIAPH